MSLLLFLLAACVPTRPVAKIGLIAPFEGIYRQSGYEALAAMRAAIDESNTGNLSIMPLALDSGDTPAQARRSMQKLLVDPSVAAVIGPFSPAAADHVADLFDPQNDGWFLPFLPVVDMTIDDALTALIAAIGEQIDSASDGSVVLAGWSTGWPDLSADEWSAQIGRPVRLSDEAQEVAANETVIWLGSAAEGADYLIQLRSRGINVPLWLAAVEDLSIFHQRAVDELARLPTPLTAGPIYWVRWLDDGYEAWAAHHSPNSPSAYAVYRATQNAIAKITGAEAASPPLRIYTFQLSDDGQSILSDPS